MQIADQLPSGDFAGIFIADSRKPDTDLVYYAKRGAIHQDGDAEVLVLADGEVQRKNTPDRRPVGHQLRVLRARFQPVRRDHRAASTIRPRSAARAYLLFAPRTDDFFMRNKPEDVRAEINRRFSEWLYALVFGTIAIYFAVGARSNRQERLWSLTAGVAVALAVRGAGFFLVNVSGINPLYAFLNFAVPIGSILLFSTLILMNKSLRFSQAWVDRRRGDRGRRHALVDQFPLRRRRAAVARQRRPAMIGHTLFLYFFRRYVATFVQFFLGVCIISYLVDFTEFSRFKSTLPGYTLGGGLLVSALRIPLIAQTAIPFIILFSAIATLMALNRRYELVVARSAGVSAWQFLAPLCLASMLIGMLVVTVFNPLGAHALAWAQQLEASFSGKEQSNFDARIPWLRQRDQDGVTIIGAKSTAQQGLQLNRGDIHPDRPIRGHRRPDRCPAGDAGRRGLADSTTPCAGRAAACPNGSTSSSSKPACGRNSSQEKLARPETIPFFDLPRKMQAAWSFGLNANGFAMQFHSLIALPMLLVAMTLIAATVSMRFARMGQSATMILGGVVAGFLLYVVSVLVKAFGTAGIRAAFCCGLDSGCGRDVFRGDVPAVQGRRLVRCRAG